MLEPIRHTLDFQRIILASASPQRREILHHVGLRFEVRPSLFDEKLDPKSFANHAEYAVETAYRKVLDVASRTNSDPNKPDIIIGADTVVSLDGQIYGKPKTPKIAEKYLHELSGREHTVHTGVVIKTHNATVKFYETCKVFMTYLNDDLIKAYIRTKEPLDKAGAYGIQGIGGSLIERIDGDYFTVMGLPLHSLCKHLVWLMEDRIRKLDLARDLGVTEPKEVEKMGKSWIKGKTSEHDLTDSSTLMSHRKMATINKKKDEEEFTGRVISPTHPRRPTERKSHKKSSEEGHSSPDPKRSSSESSSSGSSSTEKYISKSPGRLRYVSSTERLVP